MSEKKAETVAVVGASGFVGSALCERLFFDHRDSLTTVPIIHSTASAARVSRLPLELRVVDLLQPQTVIEALRGCSIVVNCSRGGPRVMLTGLHNLIKASRIQRVAKFIHLSSVLIYGEDPPSDAESESAHPNPGRNEYGRIKAKQDEMVFDLHRKGTLAYVLCPGNITGPYSGVATGLCTYLNNNPVFLVDDGRYPTNLVHVDNLVEAILTVMRSERGGGERYFVNDPEISWKRLFEDTLLTLDADCRFEKVSRADVLAYLDHGTAKKNLVDQLKIALSGEFRKGLSMLPPLDAINKGAGRLFERLPISVQERIRARVEMPVAVPARSNLPSLDDFFVRLQTRRYYHSPAKIKEELGFRPVLSYEQGLESTAEWLRFFGEIPRRPSTTIGVSG